jgi:hypothetical protein
MRRFSLERAGSSLLRREATMRLWQAAGADNMYEKENMWPPEAKFGLQPGPSRVSFRARRVLRAPEGVLDYGDWLKTVSDRRVT